MVTKWIVVFAVIMSAGIASPAARADKEDVKGIAIDVLTGIAEQAQEAQEAKKDNRCEKLEAMCDDGKDWACSKAEKECN